MSFHTPGTVLYQADAPTIQHVKSMRDHVKNICRQHINQKVRVETLDGQQFEGVIVNCDRGMLYLSVPHPHAHRAFYGSPYYSNVILPLVLYELLVITLLYT